MDRKWIKYAENLLFFSGVGLGLYAIAKIYIIRSGLPEGVCPVTDNRPLMYAAVLLLLLSLVLSLMLPAGNRKKGGDSSGEDKNTDRR